MWPVLVKLFNIKEEEDREGTSVDGENVREILEEKDVEGFVTDMNDMYGIIDNEIRFNTPICSGLNLPVIGDRVRAKVCKGRTSKYWRAISLSKHANFWEDYMSDWDSNCCVSDNNDESENQLKAKQERRRANMQFTEKLLKDKFGIEIVGDDFGQLEVSSKTSVTLEIRNQGSEVHTLESYYMIGLSQQMELGLIKIHSISLKEQSKRIQETLPLVIEPGMVVFLSVICCAKYIGKESQMIVFDFLKFKIGKELRVDVSHPSIVVEKMDQTHHRRSNGVEIIQKMRQEFKNRDVVYIPGPKLMNIKDRKYYRVKLPQYNIPEDLRDCLLEGREETLMAPCLRRPLDASNYEVRFKTLLHIEELQQEIDMKEFDMMEAVIEVEEEFLNLEVPGLMEGRPSLILGDRVMVSKNENLLTGRVSYGGSVHRVLNNVVSLKFSPEFHSTFDPTKKYSVTFQISRSTLKRCHRAVELVSKFKSDVLFPSKINPKPPLVNVILPGGSGFVLHQSGHKSAGRAVKFYNENLNQQQQFAVMRILCGVARPLPYIIFGPPGTGKTITIVESILQLRTCMPRVRILACTPSNSAADLITERLYETGQVSSFDMVRLCAALRSEEAIPVKVRPYCANIDDADLDLEEKSIVICTCSTAGSLYEGTQGNQIVSFTHVFVDEAGQATEPECMIAVALAKFSSAQIVLAGDHQQLGPVLRSNKTKEYGFDISYLERLCSLPLYQRDLKRFKDAGGYNPLLITKLVDNYRCHPALISLSSCIFYDDELIVKGESELINCLSSWDELPNTNNFPLLFHGVRGADLREGNSPSWFNPHEIVLTVKYLKSLLLNDKYAISPEDIGIITPYRKQVEKIRSMSESLGLPKVKVGSVEEFQGQERLAIIISTVRSSESSIDVDLKYTLGFLGNPKRFNVSISRAHSLLVVIGNPHILCQDVYWRSLLKYCIDNGAYVGCNLPMFTNDGHQFMDGFELLLQHKGELRESLEDDQNRSDLSLHCVTNSTDESSRPHSLATNETFSSPSTITSTTNENSQILHINEIPTNNISSIHPSLVTEANESKETLPATANEIYEPRSLQNEKLLSVEEGVHLKKVSSLNVEKQKKITRQVEYYFGEINLRRDSFLLQRISENPDGWVDISILMTFNKMKAFEVGISDVVDSLKFHSTAVKMSEDGLRLRRDPNRPIESNLEKWKEDLFSRSVVMRNYPSSELLEKMQNFFEFYGPVVHIERNILLKVWSNFKKPFYNMEKCDLILFDDHHSARNLAKHRFTRLQKMGLEIFVFDELVKQCLDYFVSRKIENIDRPDVPCLQQNMQSRGFGKDQRSGSRLRSNELCDSTKNSPQNRNIEANSLVEADVDLDDDVIVLSNSEEKKDDSDC